MLQRYHITLGAKTTAGGTVVTAEALLSINGVPIALENDKVACSACHSEGFIKADGPRLSEKWNGKEVALQDDLCMCRCSPPPRLVPSQSDKWQSIDAGLFSGDAGKSSP